jgi:hypothetical protein
MLSLPPGREHSLIDPFSTDLHGSTKYPFAAMEVGDYFFVNAVGHRRADGIRLCGSGWAERRHLDWKFSVRHVERAEGEPSSRLICVRVR